MIIIGISAFYHDSSACIIKDNKIIAAVEEERFTRKKGDNSFPNNSIEYCLNEANVNLTDISEFMFYENPFKKIDRLIKTIEKYQNENVDTLIYGAKKYIDSKLLIKERITRELYRYFNISIPFSKITYIDHHLSHASSAFFVSPYEEADVLCIDGVGEWDSTTIWEGKKNILNKKHSIKFPNSLGLLYSTITAYLGFKVNSGEYKVMGLAPYGKPIYKNLLFKNLLKESGLGFFLNMDFFDFELGQQMFSDKLINLLDFEPRKSTEKINEQHCNLASSLQILLEEEVLKILSEVKKTSNNENLVLAGGVALNCVNNTSIYNSGLYKNLWVQPASNDAGGALGASVYSYMKRSNTYKKIYFSTPYLGPSYNKIEINYALESNNLNYEEMDDDKLQLKITEKILDNKVIALFRGRMEYGPRALGNRSIIANPLNSNMQSYLNEIIKERESFRPFAPVIQLDKLTDFFELDIESPYMNFINFEKKINNYEYLEKEFKINNKNYSIKSKFPSVVHIDYSSRVQTITKKQNGFFYELLNVFQKQTNIPILLNTSFNLNDMPIVCNPYDAIKTYLESNIDILILENFYLEKNND